MRALSLVTPRDGGAWRRVDFGNLGAEELGSVYESLLELIPRYDAEQLSYTLETLRRQRTQGDRLLLHAHLAGRVPARLRARPAARRGLRQAERPKNASTALLGLTVCDPACGSGHFLVAAARRIAKRIAAEETGEPEPPDAVVRAALRRVAGRCIYGVDINPMAAELAKVSLWLEALEPGKPLSYLDQNIRVGNSLLGVTPALLAEGLPDAAFTPIEGDDRKVCAALKKQNAAERARPARPVQPRGHPRHQRRPGQAGRRGRPHTPRQPRRPPHPPAAPGRGTRGLSRTPHQKLLADAWCAAFVQPKTEETRATAITQAVLEQFGAGTAHAGPRRRRGPGNDLTRQYRFFHWHVEFPHIFRVGNGARLDPATGWSGGFSCVSATRHGRRVKLQEQEFFASRDLRSPRPRTPPPARS